MRRWTWTKKKCYITRHICFILYVTDEKIIPEPVLGLDPECVGCVKVHNNNSVYLYNRKQMMKDLGIKFRKLVTTPKGQKYADTQT